ncbi:MAG: aminoacyltransferase [Mollicutes bacterium]|nr:aminoacyltransferase [Mollicutes bacterium]
MQIKKLTAEEFKKFANQYNDYSIYQTVEYGMVMSNQKFEILYVGLIDENNNILAASLILVEKTFAFKYAYAPRGFLIDYNNYTLLKTFTHEIKKFLGRLDITGIKICPPIIRNVYNFNYKMNENNYYYDSIYDNLKDCGYYHLGYNNYFESLKPRFEAIIDINIPYYLLFKNIDKSYRTKIRNAERNGIKIYKGNEENLEYLYLQTKKKYPRDLKYFKDCYTFFSERKMIDFYYAKLDTAQFLKATQEEYEKQEEDSAIINKQILTNSNKNNKLINKKIQADLKLEQCKKNLVLATNLLRDYPDGIVMASILVIKYRDTIHVLMDGYDPQYKNFNAKHLLIWKLMEKYSKLGYKKFNLGGITNFNIENNKYQGLNQFKLNFGAKAYEYIGDLELITNNTLYFMYRNSAPIRNILKKY